MLSQEKINQIIELRNQGKTYDQIKKLTGCTEKTCVKYLKQTGNYKARSIVEITPELLEQIQQRYNEIGNIKIVAKEFHISGTRLRKEGLQLKNPIKTKEEFCAQTRYAKRIKEQLIEYKGNKCQICGYNKCTNALEFHHLDPTQKDFGISGGTKSFEKLRPEVDKCILVCSNCHREIHAGLIDTSDFIKDLNKS